MTNEIREQLTDHIYNALRDIEREKDVRLGDRAFIADHLAPKIQPLIDQAVNHEANEWIVGISEALGQGYFVYDPKLGKTGSIKRALDRVVAQAKAGGKREVIEWIKNEGLSGRFLRDWEEWQAKLKEWGKP